MTKQIRDLLRAEVEDGGFRIADVDPASTPGLSHKKRALKDLPKQHAPLLKLQDKLYAERKKALLLVLQGMDTSGKDGTITHVIGNLNPQAVQITPFKQPTPAEKRHGFLWRICHRASLRAHQPLRAAGHEPAHQARQDLPSHLL